MENSRNRVYYKISYEEGEKRRKAEKPKDPNLVKFILRCPDEYVAKFKEIDEIIQDKQLVKKGHSEFGTGTPIPGWIDSKAKVEMLDFKNLDYKVNLARDILTNHLVIYCNRENINNVKDILNNNFSMSYQNVFYKKKQQGEKIICSITTHVNHIPVSRGLYIQKEESKMNEHNYPINIVSFKRANDKCGLTHKYLCKNKINHYLFCEPFEYDEYAKWIDSNYCELIQSDENYSETQKFGSTPMRNFIMDYWKKDKYERCWILDDNIEGYEVNVQSTKHAINGVAVFTTVEEYVEKYDNVAICSHNIASLVRESDANPVMVRNGKCYSSILISLTEPLLVWSKKYQEDNFISMKALHLGYCNMCFNHVVYKKSTSGSCPGGNRETLYHVNKKGSIDGKGYGDSYNYLRENCEEMIKSGEIMLMPEKGLDDLISRGKHNSHEFHAKIDYTILCTSNKQPCHHLPKQTVIQSGNQPILKSCVFSHQELKLNDDFDYIENADYQGKLKIAKDRIDDHYNKSIVKDAVEPVVQDEVDAVGSVVQDEVDEIDYKKLYMEAKDTIKEQDNTIKVLVKLLNK